MLRTVPWRFETITKFIAALTSQRPSKNERGSGLVGQSYVTVQQRDPFRTLLILEVDPRCREAADYERNVTFPQRAKSAFI
jgi:hypothetical protein